MKHLRNLIHHNWVLGITPTAIVLFILDNDETSTIDIAEHFDIDVKTVTYHLSYLRRNEWIKRVSMVTVYGLAVSSRNGKLTKTSRNCGTYEVTDKFLKIVRTEHV